jgi:hypothetical protein
LVCYICIYFEVFLDLGIVTSCFRFLEHCCHLVITLWMSLNRYLVDPHDIWFWLYGMTNLLSAWILLFRNVFWNCTFWEVLGTAVIKHAWWHYICPLHVSCESWSSHQ